MSNAHHLPHLAHLLKKAKHPSDGAVVGAAAAGVSVPVALATAGLALTPLGWGVALAGGAIAGATYVAKKMK